MNPDAIRLAGQLAFVRGHPWATPEALRLLDVWVASDTLPSNWRLRLAHAAPVAVAPADQCAPALDEDPTILVCTSDSWLAWTTTSSDNGDLAWAIVSVRGGPKRSETLLQGLLFRSKKGVFALSIITPEVTLRDAYLRAFLDAAVAVAGTVGAVRAALERPDRMMLPWVRAEASRVLNTPDPPAPEVPRSAEVSSLVEALAQGQITPDDVASIFDARRELLARTERRLQGATPNEVEPE